MADLVGYGSYVPRWRLDLSEIGQTLGSGGSRGNRAVASYDEDSTSMGAEAAREALAATPPGFAPDQVLFVTATPAYLDKSNAVAIHAACGLPQTVAAYDFGGAARSAAGALRLAGAASSSSLVVCSDIRTGRPGSADEAGGGDAAVAFAFAAGGEPIAEVIGAASATQEFLDRWRAPGARSSMLWEERFGEAAYLPLAHQALTEAYKDAGVTADEIDHLIVTGLHGRATRAFAGASGVAVAKVADDLTSAIGNPGTAQAGLVLADVLDRAAPGAIVALVHLADGADVVLYRTTAALDTFRRNRGGAGVAGQLAAAKGRVPYGSFLTWRGYLDREPPRRPDPVSPGAPPALRNEAWKFGLSASRCTECETLHLPPARVCMRCRAVDRMAAEPVSDVRATVATYTVDHLTYSPAPPMIGAVIDLDGGGRFVCEVADALLDEVKIGARVAMTFRRLYTAPNGVHNYGWKARVFGEGGQ